MNKEHLIFCNPFFTEKFQDYAKRQNIILTDREELKKFKFLLDLNIDELKALNLFMKTYFLELRSRNKSSAEGKVGNKQGLTKDIVIERLNFFKTYQLYHHHLISEEKYNNTETSQNEVVEHGLGYTLEDKIEKGYHTSGLYLNYQRKEINGTTFYKVLFISPHPKSDEWNNFGENIKRMTS